MFTHVKCQQLNLYQLSYTAESVRCNLSKLPCVDAKFFTHKTLSKLISMQNCAMDVQRAHKT